MGAGYDVIAAAGTLAGHGNGSAHFPHRWTPGGVTVEAEFTGAHLLHLAVAGCVLNDLYREARALGIVLEGVRVVARGGFDNTWASTGIEYAVELDSSASPEQVRQLLEVIDRLAEIPRAIRTGAPVERAPWPGVEGAHGPA